MQATRVAEGAAAEPGEEVEMVHATRLLVVVFTLLLIGGPPVASLACAEAKAHRVTISSDGIPPEVKESFGPVRQGELLVLEITVENRRDEVLSIGAVQPLCACMSERSDRSIQPGSNGIITLRLETEEYSGPTTEAALIQWANAAVAVTRVELTFDVQPVLEVLPKRLVRFRGVQGKRSEQAVDLKTADGSGFEVTKVETSAPHLSAAAQAIAPGSYRLTVTLAADAPSGMLRETVTVHTTIPTLPTVKLNVTGLVVAPSKTATSESQPPG